MIILLYGKETFRLREKLSDIIGEYSRKNSSGLNLRYFEEGADFEDINDCRKQVSMFDEKKLTVVYNPFSSNKTKEGLLKELSTVIESDDVFIFTQEGELKKGDKLFKKLLDFQKKDPKRIIVQEFPSLSLAKISLWIKGEFKKRGAEIEKEAVEELKKRCGGDLWRLDSEIDKLSLYKKNITKKDVQETVAGGVEVSIFPTIDAIAEKKREEALFLLYDHLKKGDSPLYVFSMIVYQFRNLLIIADFIEKNIKYEEAKKKSGMHPFVFKKTYGQAKKFSLGELSKIYGKLFEMDLKIKTGQIDPVLATEIIIFG